MKLDGYVYTPSVKLVFTARETLTLLHCGLLSKSIKAYQATQPCGLITHIRQRSRFSEEASFELRREDLNLLIDALGDPSDYWAEYAFDLRTALLAQLVILSDEFLQMNPQPVRKP